MMVTGTMSPEVTPGDLIPPRQARQILGCVDSTLARYAERGLLRRWRRAGGTWLYSEHEVRSLLTDAREVVPGEKVMTRAESDRLDEAARKRLAAAGVKIGPAA